MSEPKKSFLSVNVASQAEASVPLPITIPGIGDTGEYLEVRSMFCKQYREAELKAKRQMTSLITAAKGGTVDDDVLEDIQMTSFCSLISGWSFEEECNVENLKLFFENNPNMYDIVNTQCATHSNFFKVSAEN